MQADKTFPTAGHPGILNNPYSQKNVGPLNQHQLKQISL